MSNYDDFGPGDSYRAGTALLRELIALRGDMEFDGIRCYIAAGRPFGKEMAGFHIWYNFAQFTTNS